MNAPVTMTHPMQVPLRDIHLPQAVSWWPPAPGWWLLAALVIAVFVLSVWWYRRRQCWQLSAVNLARQELHAVHDKYSTHNDPRRLLQEISILLRRLSISASPRGESAGLTGGAWLQYLDRPMQGDPFTSGPGKLLADFHYRRNIEQIEVNPLIDLCEEWIEAIARGKGRALH